MEWFFFFFFFFFQTIPVRYIFILVLFFQAWKTLRGPSPSRPSLQGEVVDSIMRNQPKIRSSQLKHTASRLGEPLSHTHWAPALG